MFNCRIITSQYFVGFCQTSTWIKHRYTYLPSLLDHPPTSHSHLTLLGCHRALDLSSLHHIANSHWLSLLQITMHMFQCYSLKLPCPLLPSLCPHVCSLCLHLLQFSSVQFSRSVMSNSLQPHESQHARPPCPSPTPGVYPNSCPSSQRCHPAI